MCRCIAPISAPQSRAHHYVFSSLLRTLVLGFRVPASSSLTSYTCKDPISRVTFWSSKRMGILGRRYTTRTQIYFSHCFWSRSVRFWISPPPYHYTENRFSCVPKPVCQTAGQRDGRGPLFLGMWFKERAPPIRDCIFKMRLVETSQQRW